MNTPENCEYFKIGGELLLIDPCISLKNQGKINSRYFDKIDLKELIELFFWFISREQSRTKYRLATNI